MTPEEHLVAFDAAVLRILRLPGTAEDKHEVITTAARNLVAVLIEQHTRKPLPAHLEVRTANLADGKAAGL